MMNQRLKVAFYTLGCKLNFSETSTIKRFFDDADYEKVKFSEPADIYVINTCSVTAAADKKCRHAIYRATSMSPGALIIVTGCYAQLQAETLAKIPGVDIILGGDEKFNIIKYIDDKHKRAVPEIHSCSPGSDHQFYSSFSMGDRTRSFLKVQDGCDYKCSYCTIPFARGQSRNASIDELVAEARKIAASGIKEIVLTGVNIGDFGKSTGESFFSLIRALDTIEGIARFRISSIEPELLTPEIIQYIAGSEKFAPHFHIPLQSGSDRILGLMSRRYQTHLFEKRVREIREFIPLACIGADVITGFPSETEADFEAGLQFIKKLNISYLHVFTYSARPGTKATTIEGEVGPAEKERRSKILHELSALKKKEFYEMNLGTRGTIIPEDHRAGDSITGFTANYIKVVLPWDKALVNKPTLVTLNSITPEGNMEGSVVHGY